MEAYFQIKLLPSAPAPAPPSLPPSLLPPSLPQVQVQGPRGSRCGEVVGSVNCGLDLALPLCTPRAVQWRCSQSQWRGPAEHGLVLTASLVLSEVFIEHLLSTWRPPTLLHSHSNRKSWVTVTVTVIAILVVQADRAICLKPFRLALHPVSLNTDLVPSDQSLGSRLRQVCSRFHTPHCEPRKFTRPALPWVPLSRML